MELTHGPDHQESKQPDETAHYAVSHLGLYCLRVPDFMGHYA